MISEYGRVTVAQPDSNGDRVEISQFVFLFGVVTGCDDRFFIAQWDDDVKIEDILQGDEGWVKESA